MDLLGHRWVRGRTARAWEAFQGRDGDVPATLPKRRCMPSPALEHHCWCQVPVIVCEDEHVHVCFGPGMCWARSRHQGLSPGSVCEVSGAMCPRPCLVEQLTKEGDLTCLLRGRCTVRCGGLNTS